MLRTPTAWAAPFALLAGFACANVQADEINIPTFTAQNIANWDLSFRENIHGASGGGIDRSRFPLHGPAVVGDWLRLNAAMARRQHAYATAPGTLDPNLPIHVSYEFLSWTDMRHAPRMMGFQLFDADLANSVDHLDYCGSKFSLVRVQHGNHDGWAPSCFYPGPSMDDTERFQVWGAGKSLLSNKASPVKLACRDTQFVAIDKSWHCATREEAIANGFVRTVDAWLTPKDNGAGYRLDVMIDGVDVHSDVHVPATTAERLRFGFLSKAEGTAASHAEIRNVRVSQSSMFVTKDSSESASPQCMTLGGMASHRTIALGTCTASQSEVVARAGKMLKIGQYCLTVENNVNQDGARVISHSCYDGKNQHWNIAKNGALRSMMDGVTRCITSYGTSAMRLAPCEDVPAQRFVALKI